MTLCFFTAGCSRDRHAVEATLPLHVEVRADTNRAQVLDVNAPPQARVWVASVASVRATALEPTLPEPGVDSLPPAAPTPPMLDIDDDLKPPILRSRSVLMVPPEYGRRRAVESVELDVRVDESGAVSDALWVGGSNAPILVQAATECALQMKFYPALQSGQPVPVWCRQRFDFGGSAGR
jgi:TonB family protein